MLFRVLCLSLIPFTLMAGSKRVVPPVHIQIQGPVDLEGQVQVTLMTRKTFGLKFTELETIYLDRNGKGYFEGRTLKKFKWLGMHFMWKPKSLPARNIIYEIKAKKGKRVPGGRAIDPGGDKSCFIVEDYRGGDCDNLLEFQERDGAIHVIFDLPQTYLECRDTGGAVNNVHMVGQRKINSSLNYYKFTDDQRMGAQFAQELSHDINSPPLHDPVVNQYITDMVNRIADASDMPDLPIRAQVIDADVLNAFAVPGGYIWVFRGLIENTETEAELAGVIAHEIAHVTSRHGTEGMTSAINKMTLGALAGEVISETTDKKWLREVIQTGILGGTQFWVMGGTRKREAEADKLGAQYAYRAGYDPMGIATLFARWAEKKQKGNSRLEKYFSDHPTDEERVRAVSNDVGYFLPPKPGLIKSSRRYREIKERLRRMPRPRIKGEVAANALFSSFSRINGQLITTEVEHYLMYGSEEAPQKGEMP